MSPSILDWLYPPKQSVGHSPIGHIQSEPIVLHQAALRERGVTHLDRLVAASSYASSRELQEAIRLFKYSRRRSLAVPLGFLLATTSVLIGAPIEGAVLCSVPLHWSRRFSRGFNQADLLAREVARITTMPLMPMLRRTRPTGHQAWRTHEERRKAMDNAFVATGSERHVVLIDDVATTMSTLDACAAALKSAGALHVDALVIALG